MKDFIEYIKQRRSIYKISDQIPINEKNLYDIIENSLKYTPSSFNSQSSRIVLLQGKEHKKLWDIVIKNIRPLTDKENILGVEEKISNFSNGYGTILFYEDQNTIQNLQKKYEKYNKEFPNWSMQTTGILQFIIWTALYDLNIGASIQHYNPIIDNDVEKTWSISPKWKLTAQMPFGTIIGQTNEKSFLPIKSRIKYIK